MVKDWAGWCSACYHTWQSGTPESSTAGPESHRYQSRAPFRRHRGWQTCLTLGASGYITMTAIHPTQSYLDEMLSPPKTCVAE